MLDVDGGHQQVAFVAARQCQCAVCLGEQGHGLAGDVRARFRHLHKIGRFVVHHRIGPLRLGVDAGDVRWVQWFAQHVLGRLSLRGLPILRLFALIEGFCDDPGGKIVDSITRFCRTMKQVVSISRCSSQQDFNFTTEFLGEKLHAAPHRHQRQHGGSG